jgi:hypothetical protein
MVSVFNNDDDNQNEQVQVILDNFLNFFNKNKNNDLKQWVKNFDEPNGFMFTEADEITTICNACDPKAELANSIVWFLRKCQTIFKNE